MAKKTNSPAIDIDGDETTEQVTAPNADYATEAAAPRYPDFLEGPKTKPAAGDGTGGRPWVYSEGEVRRERQGDEVRPRCPCCTRDDVAVLCKATSSREVTHYRCECCRSFRTQKLRPAIEQQMKAGSYSPPNKSPFVERP